VSARTCRASLLLLSACGRLNFGELATSSDATTDVAIDSPPRPPITIVGVGGTPDHAAAANEMVSLPGGILADDYIVLGFYANQATASVTVPSGWTTRLQYNDPNHQYQATFAWRRCGPSEPTSYSFPVANSSDVAWVLAVYRGVSAVDVDEAAEQDGVFSATTVTYTGASLVTSQTGDELVMIIINDSGSGTGLTWTSPPGMTPRTSLASYRAVLFDRALDLPGATGDEPAVLDEAGATGPSGAVWMLALAR